MAGRRHAADKHAVLRKLAQASMGGAANVEGQAVVRVMFERLRDGVADTEDFDRVVKALNTAKIRALEIGAKPLIDAVTGGQLAMTECRRRYCERKRFGFSGPEIANMASALDACEAIENASSQLQMEIAWRTSVRALKIAGGKK